MKKNIIYLMIVSLAVVCFSSCEQMFGDYLDQAPSSELPEEEVWGSIDYVTYFHNDIYNFERSGLGRINNSWLDAATDLAETSYPSGGVESSLNVGNYYSGSGYPEIEQSWSHYYTGIRKVNMFLQRINTVPLKTSETQTERDLKVVSMVREARFLRSFFYWELMIRYGGVPIVKETFSLDNVEGMMVKRNTIDECFEYVLSELNEIIPVLPATYPSSNLYKGRPTKGAALGLKAKIQLYHASPFFNPNNDLSRWEAAMNTAQEVMDLGVYQLDGNYHKMFNNIASKELIFSKQQPQGNWYPAESPVGYGGYGGLCPSQNLVDMFDMANGEQPILGYNADGTPIYNPDSGYDPQHPYDNREPRFYSTILYNGANWWLRPIETFVGGIDQPAGNTDASETSYYNCKYMDDKATDPIDGGSCFRNWIFQRYGEIYLDYAEARNEFSGPDDEVYSKLDALRSRGGSGITTPLKRNYTKEQLRERIKKERAVELAFEEHRWWDLKRWKNAEILGKPIMGMKIIRTDAGNNTFNYSYERIKVENRFFEERMYLYPIPIWETFKNSNLENNPGWQY